MDNIFNGIIRLRRDNDYNYEKIKHSFIPQNGEVCLVDTSTRGLRAKVGDGKTTFANLEYADSMLVSEMDSIVISGYFRDGKFYSDSVYTNEITPKNIRLYINISESNLYYFNGEEYQALGSKVTNATSSIAGVMKLYGSVGHNEDGTMTQKAITDELNEKIEVIVDEQNEIAIFGNF